MLREISAGAVVFRKSDNGWEIAVIEPQRESNAKDSNTKKGSPKAIFALPKGLVDPGEKPEQTAIREVWEETGLRATPVAKLGDSRYVYTRTWGDKQRVFKLVSFYLFHHDSGEIDDIAEEMRIEVNRAFWMPLEQAVRKLTYGGEKEMAKRAAAYLESRPRD
jgi:8-oxo-dGTP pyrophosphatase MutT (NUDIX family)